MKSTLDSVSINYHKRIQTLYLELNYFTELYIRTTITILSLEERKGRTYLGVESNNPQGVYYNECEYDNPEGP